ncbi:helicase HerA domain-containing protein [Actinoplanes philippinensis]|uniref:helicase HerA domain-containing protein n=1 Tax=Actinoplanes philippinensis TaxID=35752 RepID=UPI0033C4FC24
MIEQDQRRALTELRRLDWAPTPEDVWTDLDVHLDELNGTAGAAVLQAFEEAEARRTGSPLGLVVEGQHGSGKTHLLRWAREKVQQREGYFFLMGIADGRTFWPNIVHTLLRGLRRSGYYRHTQLAMFLERLSERAEIPSALRRQIRGQAPLTPAALDAFVTGVRIADPEAGRDCRFTLRALVLLAATDPDVADLGESWLLSLAEPAPADAERWGLPRVGKSEQDVAVEISRLLALTGPSMLAVDQIDVIFAQSDPGRTAAIAADLGHGLMDLREKLFRTVTVVACLPTSWERIRHGAPGGRFRQESRLRRLPSRDVGERLIAARFAPLFEAAEFKPPYFTWPILPEAFDAAPDHTPRQLIERADEHVRYCLARDEIVPLADLAAHRESEAPPARPADGGQLSRLDDRLRQLRDAADVTAALDPSTEDAVMSRLLEAGLRAWAVERGGGRYAVQPVEQGNPSAHAWLCETLDSEIEDEAHWYFRGLAHSNARAVQARLARLRSLAGLDPAVSKRCAILLRNHDWPTGPVSARVRTEFLGLGGVITTVDPADLRTFAALAVLLEENDPALPGFLRSRQPAGWTALFSAVLGAPATDVPLPGAGVAEATAGEPSVRAGVVTESGAAVELTLESLRKHTVIFAGSGSGKTVLIRRLVEECALHGVSAIVLDPNNDLARLGDAWPQPPDSWTGDDAARARAYLDGTDVVVWTPRRESGRPLTLQPLPDFAAVLDEPDEFALALDAAVATLAPRARMATGTAKADRGRAVLRKALEHFGRAGGRGLVDFTDLLTDLPDEATTLGRARELAAEMAETLKAAMVNDPLLAGAGTPLDPGVLLTPPAGRRARVSVINLIGLNNDDQRQSFVNQLQMALFSWIKRHPAGDRPLGGLFVMDEAQTFAPSGAQTACTESTLALAGQARKYGLGLIFATQAPKGIHNRIVGNAATQFFGFLNSPAQIAAAREVAQTKGSAVLDISRLRTGQFYAVTEGRPFRKISTAMCLTHHPKSALTTEEVLRRARP